MYADDLLLLSASVGVYKKRLDECHAACIDTDMEFNIKKCTCSVVGPASLRVISDMKLGIGSISWVNDFKYLGISFKAGKSLSVYIFQTKCKFFSSCNFIFGNLNCMHEILKLKMILTFFFP